MGEAYRSEGAAFPIVHTPYDVVSARAAHPEVAIQGGPRVRGSAQRGAPIRPWAGTDHSSKRPNQLELLSHPSHPNRHWLWLSMNHSRQNEVHRGKAFASQFA